MVLAMNAKITFSATENRKEIVLKKITSVHIESGWKRLTDTATITFARNVIYFDKHKVKETFKKGDPVKIELGYNGNFNKEFEGYITQVSADIPITIKCEDEMYQLKKVPVNVSIAHASLEELLVTILPGYDIDALNVELGSVRFPKTTVAKVLDYLKTEFSLYSYMKGKQLVCGKVYADDSALIPIKLHLEKNVVNNSLDYKSKEDVLIRIVAISTLIGGNKIKVEVGDKTGEERQLTYYNIVIKAELEKLAKEDLKKYKVDGFTGSITAYGIPFIQHGNKIDLTSDLYPDRNGIYYVEETIVDFGESGFRRKVQLGDKVTA